ncbi:MAG TPA: MBL fold metallo-hydrolase [Xanthobacteraceae bacterium]|nr:MBL fold metallo-hydrolase [Xanthobacteraceae bacterium]
MKHAWICTTCGTQYEPSEQPAPVCSICDEERQYVLPTGQQWTSLTQLRKSHMATFHREAELIGIGTAPAFGIGQRALLVRTPQGNVLWDCISLIDDAIVQIVNALGGLKAIAISHPHYYTTMVDWSAAFGDIPVYLHAADQRWIMRSAPCLKLWTNATKEVLPGLTLIRVGGHFEGGTVMHWAKGAGSKGALLSGDLLQVTPDRKFVSFMWSYPNYVPLGENAVRAIAKRLDGWSYDTIYGAFWDRVIAGDGANVTAKSVARHIEILQREAP